MNEIERDIKTHVLMIKDSFNIENNKIKYFFNFHHSFQFVLI